MNDGIPVEIQDHNLIDMPVYETDGSAGFDLQARIDKPVLVTQRQQLIPTGLRMAIPQGFELQIRSRSGKTLKEGFSVLNAPGTIDSDYRGEIGVIVHFVGGGLMPWIKPGEKFAQGVLAPVGHAAFHEALDLDETMRGTGGFGSTGN